MGYLEENINKIIQTPGGKLCQVFGISENANASVALVKMYQKEKGVHHYHDNITEIYFFAKGKGKIIINSVENVIEQGDCYIIPPKNGHLIVSETEMDFECICIPPWEEEHEFIIEENKTVNNMLIKKCNSFGKIADIFDNGEVVINKLKTNEEFETIVDNNLVEVYYFAKGKGKIIIDGLESQIHEGEALLVKPKSKITISADTDLIYSKVTDSNSLN